MFGLRAFCISIALCVLGTPSHAQFVEAFVEPYRKFDLAPAEPGLISTVEVQEGQAVRKGEILATLERDVLEISREIAVRQTQAEGRRRAALADVALRRARHEQLVGLHRAGHASEEELRRARGDLELAEGQLLALDEQQAIDALELKKAEALLERRLIRSPVDGVVTKVHREAGEFLTVVNPVVVSLAQVSPLRVTFHVPFAAQRGLAAGQTVEVELPDLGTTVTARVETILPVIDAESGTVRVKLLLDNAEGHIRCGMRCSWRLELPAAPLSAVTP